MKYHLTWVGVLVLVTLAHFAIHEFAHALAAKLLGYDVVITLNTVRPLKEAYDSAADASLISITGPVVTLLIALFAALYARRHKSLVAFMVVVSALFQRAIAQLVSLGNPNDEMRVSIDLGLGLSIGVTAGVFGSPALPSITW